MFVASKYLPNPHDPFQDPAWRWSRCAYLLEHNRSPSPTLDDAVTGDAWSYLRDLRRCRDDADRATLAQRHPIIATAHQLFSTAQSLKRAELEARLLARESDETIAAKCSLSPAAVHAFHDLFYDVRSSLEAECYIVNVAIGAEVHYGLTPGDHELLMKLVGYSMGPVMLDKLLDYFAAPPVLSTPLPLLGDSALEDLHQKLLIKAMVVSMTLPADGISLDRLAAVRKLLARDDSGRRGRTPAEKTRLSPLAAALDFREYLRAASTVADNAAERQPDVCGAGLGEDADSVTAPLVGSFSSWVEDWVAVPA